MYGCIYVCVNVCITNLWKCIAGILLFKQFLKLRSCISCVILRQKYTNKSLDQLGTLVSISEGINKYRERGRVGGGGGERWEQARESNLYAKEKNSNDNLVIQQRHNETTHENFHYLILFICSETIKDVKSLQ